jgi:biotin synthase
VDRLLTSLGEKVLGGTDITRDEASFICGLKGDDVYDLFHWANKLRRKFLGDEISCCSLVSAKQGKCSEDCSFCAQSARFDAEVDEFPLVGEDALKDALGDTSKAGAGSLGIVTSGRELSDTEADRLCDGVSRINGTNGANNAVSVHGSLGLLSAETARRLKESGLRRINHNLETSENFFPRLCTSHSYGDRVRTIKLAMEAGLEVCSGGIFGVGETAEDRVDLAFTLKELDVDTVPLNFLHPVAGTPLADVEPLNPIEILRIIALFRFIMPAKEIKVAGGREKNLGDMQSWIFYAGANSIIIGGYLTTKGRPPEEDLRMISDLGLSVKR